ncbi:hypothetical protein ABKA04_003614 [Annulohypoxylon sp. FPYF3050]
MEPLGNNILPRDSWWTAVAGVSYGAPANNPDWAAPTYTQAPAPPSNNIPAKSPYASDFSTYVTNRPVNPPVPSAPRAPTPHSSTGRPDPYEAMEFARPASPKKRPEKRCGAEAPQRRRVKLILGSKWVDPDADLADDESQGQGIGKKKAVIVRSRAQGSKLPFTINQEEDVQIYRVKVNNSYHQFRESRQIEKILPELGTRAQGPMASILVQLLNLFQYEVNKAGKTPDGQELSRSMNFLTDEFMTSGTDANDCCCAKS